MAGVIDCSKSATSETNLLHNSVGPETIEERPSEAGCSGVVGVGVIAGEMAHLNADEVDRLSAFAMQQGAIIVGRGGTNEREGARSGTDLSTTSGYSWADSELSAVPIVDLHDGGQLHMIMDFSSMPEILTIVGGPYPQENYVRYPHAIPIVPFSSNPSHYEK